MMKVLRKHMKIILWVVVLAFVGTIFFVWGMGGSRNREILNQQSAAVVNEQPVSYSEFERIWEQQSQQLAQAKEAPTQEQIARLRSDLMSDLIDRTLLKQLFDQLKLKVYPEEVAARIAAMPAFQENGKFSGQKYISLLQYNRINPEEFEADQKNSLQILKMDRLLRDATVVSEDQLRAYFQNRSRQLKLAVAAFNWKDRLKSAVVTDAQVREYFGSHKSDFDRPAEVRASHILVKFPEGAGEEQKLTAKLKAENLRSALLKGQDFAESALKNSEDPGSAEKGGDLGFFKPGMMVPEFDKAAFALKVGEISQPIATQFGYHIIKVTDRKEAKTADLASARPKILDILKEETARRQTLDASRVFMQALKKTSDVAAAARLAGVKLITTAWLKVDGTLPGIAQAETILDRAFDLPVGKPSSGITAGDGMAFVQVTAEKYQPFSEAAFQRQRDALQEKFKDVQAEQTLLAWLEAARAKGKIVNNIKQEKVGEE
jgi:peptidyl-prolyl cis-trans isomerase D